MKKLLQGIALIVLAMVVAAGALIVGYPIFLMVWVG